MNDNTKGEMIKMLNRFLDTCTESSICGDCERSQTTLCSVAYVNKCTDMSWVARKELCKSLMECVHECRSIKSCQSCKYEGRIQYQMERCIANRSLLKLTGKGNPEPTREEIQLRQYENLRRCITYDLVHPILGKDYHNMGHDTYQSDKITTQDIRNKYLRLQGEFKSYKRTVSIVLGLSWLLTVVLLFV